MKLHPNSIVRNTLLAALSLGSSAYGQILFINSATDTFVPSFRAEADLGNTTFYGWSNGTFDGAPDNELLNNPVPTLGVGGLDGTLAQAGTVDILSGSNNIFIGVDGRTETLNLGIPTNGTPGLSGFTTIIIQGLTLGGGGLLVNVPIFGLIDGVSPTFVAGANADNEGQWWAKYEIPGNAALYNLQVTVSNVGGQSVPLSIAQMTVDTVFSPGVYASDTAVAVPEPCIAGLFGIGGLTILLRRRR